MGQRSPILIFLTMKEFRRQFWRSEWPLAISFVFILIRGVLLNGVDAYIVVKSVSDAPSASFIRPLPDKMRMV